MKLSSKWLKDYVDIDVEEIGARHFAEAMTMSGSKVETYEKEASVLKNIVVGKILSVEKHPNANKLYVCKVDIAKESPIQIVTSATNIKVGDLVPVALHLSKLIDGTGIAKGKLRGEISEGMFCSIHELGLTLNDFPYAEDDGIFVIQENCKIGQDIRDAVGYNDTVFDFEITSNRIDCFSVIGLAREAAITFGKQMKEPKPQIINGKDNLDKILDVGIEDDDLCYMYSARIVDNVKIKPSPRWLRERLRAMGVRPINNIVDITNYVMLEYGQPMHAFDYRNVKDNTIRVRRAKKGENIKTLDDVVRPLEENQLVIADSEKPIAIAGVMGGELSSISDDTTTIVFESANFNAASIRNTARVHGMRTDSSSLYEKGLDPNNCLPALDRACELIEKLDAGEVLTEVFSDKRYRKVPVVIDFDYKWINKFLNIDLTEEQMIKILNDIGCKVGENKIVVPSFRSDLLHKADIAEEIARFYGYNNILTTQLSGKANGKYSRRQNFDILVNTTMASLGLDEIMTYSFISPKDYDKIMLSDKSPSRNSLVIANPLGEDTSVMRTTALPSILEVVARNYNNRNNEVAVYECARTYIKTADDRLPNEKNVLNACMYGKNQDFYTAKGVAEDLLKCLDIADYDVVPLTNTSSFHPGRCAGFIINGATIGIVAEVHPLVLENYNITTRVYALYFDMDLLYEFYSTEKTYKPLPKFPAVSRDLAFVCDEDTEVSVIVKTITRVCSYLLEDIDIFDVYKGEQIAANKKSIAIKITLRSYDSTLTDEQVNIIMDTIVKKTNEMGITLRD